MACGTRAFFRGAILCVSNCMYYVHAYFLCGPTQEGKLALLPPHKKGLADLPPHKKGLAFSFRPLPERLIERVVLRVLVPSLTFSWAW